MRPTAAIGWIFAAAMLGPEASADELKWDFSGYGTIAAAALDDPGLEFLSSNVSKGVKDEVTFGHDSRIGFQLSADLYKRFSFMWQAVAKRRIVNLTAGDDRDFTLRNDWLYGEYGFDRDAAVRLGRMALSTYLLSESLDIGYAAPWLRAPPHIYSSAITTSFDGVEASSKTALGAAQYSVRVFYGKSKSYISQGGANASWNPDPLYGLNGSIEWNDWTARLGSVSSRGTLQNLKLRDSYNTAGLQYDDGRAVVMAEYAHRATKTRISEVPFVQRTHVSYLAAGWRFGKLLPLLMASRLVVKYPASLDPSEPYIRSSFHARGISLRYDVAPNLALKAQVDRYQAADASVFQIPRDADVSPVHLYSVGLDFIF